nr:chloride channel protein [Clostridia bacterium]
MNRNEVNHYQEAISFSYRKIALIGKSICIGVCVGAVASLYRLVLGKAETSAFALYAYFKGHTALIPLVFLGLGLLGYGVGCLSERYRFIGGSGIPQVKGSLTGHFDVPWLSTMAAKFVGGAASILAGLSLGREGPSIQLGAC